jgi:cephalosporin-C deacetylase-like acetyl esterase
MPLQTRCVVAVIGAIILALGHVGPQAPAADSDLAAQLRDLEGTLFLSKGDKAQGLAQMLVRDAQARLRAANLRENQAWQQVQTRAKWEQYHDARLHALRASLGRFPTVPKELKVRITRRLEGDGYRVEDLVFESRPGLLVTANLYLPARPTESMPGILISHSHHNPKTQGELQDMGMTWARAGCLVLIPDHLGHGERRQHPFRTATDYPHPFRLGRQDYYFRYVTGLQLHLAGESLMAWMAWDLMRGVDLLLSRSGVDPKRIIVLGSVAGGGDPAAVAAAVDPRIQAVVSFNFGGPQPDYSIPADAARDFYYFGIASWESTRCLRLGARDGFAQWLIVAAVAPRRLVYAHEFAWDREHDPVWPRLRQVFDWYGTPDHLKAAFGQGTLKGSPPESSHCNNIGPLHRSRLYPILQGWWNMPIPTEYSRRRPAEELLGSTPAVVREFRAQPVHELAAALGANQVQAARQRLAGLTAAERRRQLRADWQRLLGEVTPSADPKVLAHGNRRLPKVTVEQLALQVERDIVVPFVLLVPDHKPGTRLPVVVGLAQAGKQAFLRQRADALAELLNGGVAVCLPDVRGTGESRPADASRRHGGASTTLSATEWLLGQTLVGARLRDLRSVLRYLRTRADLAPGRVALWGDSLAPPNPPDRNLAVPLDADPFPDQAEPLGGLLALFGTLYEDDIRVVYAHGGLVSYQSLLQGPFCYVPHDALIPAALTVGDLPEVTAALAPRPLRLEGMVDGLNCRVPADVLEKRLAPARAAYHSLQADAHLLVEEVGHASRPAARWVVHRLLAD